MGDTADETAVGNSDTVVGIEFDRGVARITLDSQANRNALSRALVAQLHERLDEAEAAGSRAIVLTHAGPAFCAGADLKERSSGPPDSGPFVAVLERLMDTPRPTIAAVHGSVRAGGIGLMAACDLVVVHRDVTFALTEVRIGVAAAIISVPILRRVAPGRIATALYTGAPFDADHAMSIGLVTHVADDVAATVSEITAGILAGAPAAVSATKRILAEVPGLDRGEGFERMRRLSDEMFGTPDAAEGMAAFREKRQPAWQSDTGNT